jgi:hypothetical protein
MLVPAIVSPTERTLLFTPWWSLALRVFGCRCESIRGLKLGEEYWDRGWLRSKRIALGAGGVLGAVLVLVFRLVLVGELAKIVRSGL